MDIATRTSELLKDEFSGCMHLLDDLPIWMLFAGYEAGELKGAVLYSNMSDREPFDPIQQPLFPGLIGAKLYWINDQRTQVESAFRKNLQKYLNLYHPHTKKATEKAFTELVETYEAEGYNCGGEIYTETLKP